MSHDLHESLRENVRILGDSLGQTIADDQGRGFVDKIETIRSYAKRGRQGEESSQRELIDYLRRLPDRDLLPVTRAFNQFLNLANIAEQHYRARFRRVEDYRPGTQPVLSDLLEKARNAGNSPRKLVETLAGMRVELVLTAHPTEVIRRTLIQKYDAIDDCLSAIESCADYPERGVRAHGRLSELISQAWHTDEIRHERPTPVDEAKWGFAVIENSLWQAVPDFHRDLDNLLLESAGERLPLDAAPIRFASWMGGDRDGNPNVTAKVTREVLLLGRWMAADLYLRDLEKLKAELSMWKANSALKAEVGDVAEPYRELVKRLLARVEATRDWAKAQLDGRSFDSVPIIESRDQLYAPLLTCYRSLCDVGLDTIANGALLDTLRRVAVFGVTLTKLDLRQEASRHAQVMEELTEGLGLGHYREWNEEQRQQFLLEELTSRRPLIPRRWECSAESREVIDTFRVISGEQAEALGTYVISMAGEPSDVLAVALLMKEVGGEVTLPIAPLFETLDDLNHAGEVIDRLLALPGYRALVGDRQEVMIGYSDSAKDAGQLAAAWAQYRAQETLVEVCDRHGVDLTLFHGRGGTVGRGGGPAHAAILSQPPGSVNGSLRVTEQGEMIRFKFGQPEIALRSMEIYACAVLEATLLPPPAPEAHWREEMDRLAEVAHAAYVGVVREDPDFVPYFRSVTPEGSLGRLPLGSRPTKRRQDGGVETLRAIPWIFAWTQTRLMLPAWLGSGEAFARRLDEEGGLEVLQEMRENWPFFGTYLDMLEMLLAKADVGIAAYYEHRLVDEPSLKALGENLRNRFTRLQGVLLSILQQQELLETTPLIRQAIAVRNPYIDPLHGLQAELLQRNRDADGAISADLSRALMVTMAGIAAGLRNTG
ncbi:phosphoenolpyruvate carboxylase [Halomonas urumqiensis]|uniref:Phosphoenolpyruvate carboxylase n=1 Tax=Halomonas urumqiensis TaxID=1684789 RepID=A0A2N7UQY2_9GAMM|nr:phosphoenolpyruvate carboxylase [Halomonas urumqiensis]PMR82847.1 phosphoenolpyruvate carboxylase [Halomonas urumqiensis]PTB01835.1 phosphoenolpyruvate carboxylase [Halomonas urumqiensis]GHE21936.1 phosphoenolpyruvate carboxylase [Halomonas urumqiensis]